MANGILWVGGFAGRVADFELCENSAARTRSETVMALLKAIVFEPMLALIASASSELAISNGNISVGKLEVRVADRF